VGQEAGVRVSGLVKQSGQWADGEFFFIRLTIEPASTHITTTALPLAFNIMTTTTSAAVIVNERRTLEDASSIDALPAEILDHLMDLCANTPEAQRELRLVSKRWCAHVDTRMWDSLTELRLSNSRASGAFVERLCRLLPRPDKVRT
jgi:hypothetical protein